MCIPPPTHEKMWTNLEGFQVHLLVFILRDWGWTVESRRCTCNKLQIPERARMKSKIVPHVWNWTFVLSPFPICLCPTTDRIKFSPESFGKQKWTLLGIPMMGVPLRHTRTNIFFHKQQFGAHWDGVTWMPREVFHPARLQQICSYLYTGGPDGDGSRDGLLHWSILCSNCSASLFASWLTAVSCISSLVSLRLASSSFRKQTKYSTTPFRIVIVQTISLGLEIYRSHQVLRCHQRRSRGGGWQVGERGDIHGSDKSNSIPNRHFCLQLLRQAILMYGVSLIYVTKLGVFTLVRDVIGKTTLVRSCKVGTEQHFEFILCRNASGQAQIIPQNTKKHREMCMSQRR